MRRLIVSLICLLLVVFFAGVCMAENNNELSHNYILIIDNSRSTTGRHSLGNATDPHGLRFDAARLVYENVVSSSDAANQGQIGIIIFCGPENCMSYGPMNTGADSATLDGAIGNYLNEAANEDHRDNFTDIKTALEAARSMMLSFSGKTSVLLLTDGVNDLTNRANPFNEPENIEANDQSVAIVGDLKRLGADFYIVALTAQDSVKNTDTFMAFINRMAKAGGGELSQDGGYNNVLMATQTDLNSKLLQMLIRAETTTDATIQNDILYTPLKWPFRVPYKGINDATVNITFMPEDKTRIDSIKLITPNQKTYTLYGKAGGQPTDGIRVSDDRSYIILDIPSPAPGEWNVEVTSRKGEKVPINTVVRFNHKLRLCVDIPDRFYSGSSQTFSVWFQRYNGSEYEDLTDSDIYQLSTVTLDILGPGTNSQPQTIKLKRKGSRYSSKLKPKATGTWLVEIEAKNNYWSDRVNDLSFEVLPAPTATPTPTAAPAPTEAPTVASAPVDDPGPVTVFDGSAIIKSESAEEDFFWTAEADPKGEQLIVSWLGNGADEAEAELIEKGTDTPVETGLHSGDGIDLNKLDPDSSYTILLTAFTSPEDGSEAPPMIQGLDLQLVPDAEAIGDAVLSVAEAMVKLSPADLNEETLQNAIEAAKALQEGMDTLAKAAESAKEEETEAEPERPLDVLPEGLTMGESIVEQETASPEPTAEPTVAPTPTDMPTATAPVDTPTPAPTAAPAPSVIDTLKANWIYLAGGIALLAVLAGVILIIRERTSEKVSGNLKIECPEINLEMLLRFDGKGKIKVNSPLTRHPDIAKLKGGKIYDVLSTLRVGMAKSDNHGMVSGSDVQHMPNDRLISVTYTDPRNGEQQSIYLGKNDIGEAVLNVYDAGRIYKLIFNGNLSFDELVHTDR